MQKLEKRNTYTPLNTVPVQCNCDSLLNKEDTLSVTSLKTSSNNSEEHLQSGKTGHNLVVYVLNMRGNPLMPTTPRKARKLLEQKKAKVIHRTPFTIQLLYATGENKQDIKLGIDPGYSFIGYSAVSSSEELISGELELRNDIKKLLKQRASYRRTRRGRLWYREPRFNNRSKDEGWLAPSIQHKFNSHLKLIEKITNILPITKIVIEIAKFDTQKMQNPEISGIEYQHGTLEGYNIRLYLLEKFKYQCAYCNKTDVPFEIEHIIPKSKGGSNRVSNLAIACHKCNQKKGNQTAKEFGFPNIQKQAKKPLKASAFMNIVSKRLFKTTKQKYNTIKVKYTFGYKTNYRRNKQELEKTHVNDAFVIVQGKKQIRTEYIIISKQVRRQNRSLYKANLLKGGRLKRNTIKEVKGFRRFDKVKFENKVCFIHGLRTSGYFHLKSITGEKIHASASYKKLTLLEHARGIIQEVCTIPPYLSEGVSLRKFDEIMD